MARKKFAESHIEGPSMIDENSDIWLDIFLALEESSGRGAAGRSRIA
jgi:hypothetical protein